MFRAIALFKLCKAALFIAVGVAVLRFVRADDIESLADWVPRMGLGPASRYIGRALVEMASLTPTRVREVGLGSFFYAGLFLIEGFGLWFLKRWAAWMTIVLTSSLVPVEIWEIFRHPSVPKVLVLGINVGLVAYLFYEVKKTDQELAEAGLPEETVV